MPPASSSARTTQARAWGLVRTQDRADSLPTLTPRASSTSLDCPHRERYRRLAEVCPSGRRLLRRWPHDRLGLQNRLRRGRRNLWHQPDLRVTRACGMPSSRRSGRGPPKRAANAHSRSRQPQSAVTGLWHPAGETHRHADRRLPITTAVMLSLLAGIAIKFKIFGGGP